MEQYLNAIVKGTVQKYLFSHIKSTKVVLGLAGTHPEEYIKVLPTNQRTILVDFNPVNPFIRRNSIIGEFDLLLQERALVTFVDCDFCKSYKSNGDDLLYIYNKMKKNTVRNKYIAFTFSLRRTGLEDTIKWLSSNIPECKTTILPNAVSYNFGDRRYLKILNPYLIQYRDSGDNMISGLIKL